MSGVEFLLVCGAGLVSGPGPGPGARRGRAGLGVGLGWMGRVWAVRLGAGGFGVGRSG